MHGFSSNERFYSSCVAALLSAALAAAGCGDSAATSDGGTRGDGGSGGDDGGTGSDDGGSNGAQGLFTVARLVAGQRPRSLRFEWSFDGTADHFIIEVDPTGASGYGSWDLDGDGMTDAGDRLPGSTDLYERPIALLFTDLESTLFRLVALDGEGSVLERSGDLALADLSVEELVGYFKASNTQDNDRFGGIIDTSIASESHQGAQSVSLSDDGATLAVGAPTRGDVAAGAVYVFTDDGRGVWSEEAFLQASNAGDADRFGLSVALSADGSVLAVGAPLEDGSADGTTNEGAVYLFARDGGSWTELDIVKADDRAETDVFGIAVALSDTGDTLAVGAMGKDTIPGPGGVGAGAAYVFVRSGEEWSQQERIISSSAETNDLFGYRVALSASGDTLAIGAESDGNTERPPQAGAVHVFTRSGASWSEQQVVLQPTVETNARFGSSVALSDSGDRLAVGAQHVDSYAGAVYVFHRVGGTWSLEQELRASNADDEDRLGSALALSGDGRFIAAGAPSESSSARALGGAEDDNGAMRSGATYLFVRDGSDWTQSRYVKASNTDANDFFGQSMSISRDGRTLAVGAGGEGSGATGVGGDRTDNSENNAGAVYLY